MSKTHKRCNLTAACKKKVVPATFKGEKYRVLAFSDTPQDENPFGFDFQWVWVHNRNKNLINKHLSWVF